MEWIDILLSHHSKCKTKWQTNQHFQKKKQHLPKLFKKNSASNATRQILTENDALLQTE